MGARPKPPLGRDEARDVAIAVAASAAAKELVHFARYSDSPELVRAVDRPGYDAVVGLVTNERHAATMLLRYAQGRVAWLEVESVLGCVGVRRTGLGGRLERMLGTRWRTIGLAFDIAEFLKKCGLTSE